MKLIAVLEGFSHHNAQTSPDNMVYHIRYDHVFRPAREFRGGRLLGRIDSLLRRHAGMTGYNIYSFMSEFQVVRNSLRDASVVHFFNGDINCKWTPYLKGRSRVLTTYHQPPDFFHQFLRKCEHIRKLDAALVTSNALRDLLSRYLPHDHIFFQPLAVDTDFFRPPLAKEPSVHKRCIMVGNWLRDFETARAVVDKLESRTDISFRVISDERNRIYFSGCDNVTFLSGIPVNEYLAELHAADIMMLPLKSGTSNLAVLEAMASGLPIVTNDLPGTRDYVDPSFCTLVRDGNANEFSTAVADLLDDNRKRASMSACGRQRSLKFSWPRVAERLMDIYRKFGADPIAAPR